MANFCPNCGAKLIGTERFCADCGNPVVVQPNPDTNNSTPQTAYSRLDFSAVTEKAKNKKTNPLLIILCVVAVIVVFGMLAGQTSSTKSETTPLTRAEYIKMCEDVDYEDVARNPNDYDGRYVSFTGRVIQVSEGTYVTLRINQDKKTDQTWYARYKPEENESRILENDVLTVYGKCTGTKSYTAVLGNQVTIPAISIEYYDLH